MLKYALLLYLKLVGYLTRSGFKLNLYDPCVMNKIVEGDQITVVFHVDDMKELQKRDKTITKVIEYLDGIYPGLKVLRGDVCD